MTVTIKDIARKLGVSATAVSKALNDRDDISQELKKKVRKVAEEMDYSANTIAKRLVTKKSNTIGVFMLSRVKNAMRENFGFQFVAGILEEANQNGYDIVLFSTNNDLLPKKSYIKLCKERQVEGAIFTGLRLDDPHIAEIKNSSFPIVIIDTKLKGKNVGYVSTDNKKGVYKALDYLWNLGHRKIAMINGHSNAQVSQKRLDAFRDYLTKKGVFDKNLVYAGDYTKESGYHYGKEIIKLKKLPTAIFVASDYMALGVMKALKDEGLSLPEDMSIIGFDNVVAGEYVEPSLTTVGQDAIGMGRKAAQWVIKSINGENISSHIYLEPELIIRNSCSALN